MKKKYHLKISLLLVLVVSVIFSSVNVCAAETDNETIYYLGNTVNAGNDTGYSENNKIVESDPHFGWTLGKFFLSGYTRVTEDDNGNPVFLKTVGDKVTLWFNLEQDINKLNGDESLTIGSDTNGYDEYFDVKKTDFGQGTLIIRHTDYQNKTQEPIIYTDYLSAKAKTKANVQVELFEEGDYEIALDYEIKKTNLNIFGWDPFPSYYNYRIYFRFSVRNGNCMVYPFDVKTKAELLNTSITENGFYLDLAKSRYLDIDIKKEVMNEGANGLTEDVRFNHPAKDGDKYTDEGIYTITVSNRYTEQQTVKKIYVGNDDILKAYVTTGIEIPEIKKQLSMGATISEDGKLITAANIEIPVVTESEPVVESVAESQTESITDVEKPNPSESVSDTTEELHITPLLLIILSAICLVVVAVVIIIIYKKKKSHNETTYI